jgi:release factor glutamine methyltransferase
LSALDHTVPGEPFWNWYQQARQATLQADVPLYELDWFLHAFSDLDRLALRLGSVQHQPKVMLGRSLPDLEVLWQQRLTQRVPVQYLVGQVQWRSFWLQVSPAVLIPRPETELIIDLVQVAVAQAPILIAGPWVDLGTGSGAIALGLADLFPQAPIYGVDCSAAALAVARQNGEDQGMGDRIHWVQGSWFDPLGSLQGQICGMVSNPPYIPTATVSTLQPEVVNHEPRGALDGGEDGLDSIRTLIKTAPQYLRPGGFWIVELMAGQAPAVAQLLADQGQYREIQIHLDLAGVERFVSAFRIAQP